MVTQHRLRTCPIESCRKALTNSYKLKLHLERFHYNVRNFLCVNCLKTFKSRDSLNRHSFRHREVEAPVDFSLAGARGVALTSKPSEFPLLSRMLKFSLDPELKPYVHIRNEYPFVHDTSRPLLAPISPKNPEPSNQ